MKGEAPIDTWTIVHVASGFALGVLAGRGVPWWAALGSLVAFEAFEALVRSRSAEGGVGLAEHESPRNVIADVIAGSAGYIGGYLLAVRR